MHRPDRRRASLISGVLVSAVMAGAGCSTDDGIVPSELTHPTGATVTSTVVADRPFGIDVSKDGIVYVTRLDAAAITRLSLATGVVEGAVAVGSAPTDVAFNAAGTTAYVANQLSEELGTVNVGTGTQTADLAIPGATFRVRVHPNGNRVYVSSNSDSVFAINPATNTIVARFAVGLDPNGFAFSADGGRLYVSNQSSGTISEINTASNTVTRSFTVGGTPQDIALSPDGTELYIANLANGIQVLNLGTSTVVATGILDQGGFSLAVTPDGAQLYVGATLSGKVYVIDRASRTILQTLTVGGLPRRIAFSAKGDVAVVANESGSVVFIR